MKNWLSRYDSIAYALLRLIAGLLFACHGTQKLFGWPGGATAVNDPLLITAAVIELAGGLAIALGLWVSLVAFIASGEMAVAYFKVHAHAGFWPVLNGGELAVLYSFLFLYLATHGSGSWSLDRLWAGRRHPA